MAITSRVRFYGLCVLSFVTFFACQALWGQGDFSRLGRWSTFLKWPGLNRSGYLPSNQGDLAQIGRWSQVSRWPGPNEHAYLLPTGKVMFFQGNGIYTIWNPANGGFGKARKPPYDIDCSGHAFLEDGRLLIAGGMRGKYGLEKAVIYNPYNDTWTPIPDMNDGRYYPTVTSLPNGEALVVSGTTMVHTQTTFLINGLPQVWQPQLGSWRDLTSAVSTDIYYYPYCFVAPNSKVFCAGPRVSRYLDTSGTGSWTTVSNLLYPKRYYGSAVMYSPGKVLTMGGDSPPTATAEAIDLNSSSPVWRYVGSMSVPRHLLDATILPDGSVLVTGGGSSGYGDDPSNPALAAETWSPTTETWTTLASASIYRGLHSIALLLPDGRVLTAGGDYSPRTAEIFSPPYLFRGARPVVNSVPASVRYAQEFMIGTPNASEISKVTLIRLGAVTHDFNMNQRLNELNFWQVQGGLMAQAPANRALCPPGHYMLFVLNSLGVPSVARIIRVRR